MVNVYSTKVRPYMCFNLAQVRKIKLIGAGFCHYRYQRLVDRYGEL